MPQTERSKYKILLTKNNNQTETYRVSKNLFKYIRELLSPFRSVSPAPITVKCIETNECFNSAKSAAIWLQKQGILTTYTTPARIKNACKSQKPAYGYHWEFVFSYSQLTPTT